MMRIQQKVLQLPKIGNEKTGRCKAALKMGEESQYPTPFDSQGNFIKLSILASLCVLTQFFTSFSD